MKVIVYLILLIVPFFVSCGSKVENTNTTINTVQQDTTSIVIGNKHIIHSEVLGEDREIFIHVPKQDQSDFDTVSYPVVYLFDGFEHFQAIVAIMNQLSSSFGDEICPKMIVVGIKQNDRMKDLGFGLDSEGTLKIDNLINDKFTEFIEKEVIAYVDASYHTMPYRVLIGYSLGGLKAMNIIAYNTNLFNAYIVIDPSFGIYDNQWYNASIDRIKNTDLSNKSVFLAMAQTMPMGTDTIDVKRDTTTDSNHMRKIMQAADVFRKNSSIEDFTWMYYPNEYHGSVPLIAEYDAFNAIFEWYNLQNLRFVFKSDDSPLFVKEAITEHFEKASQKIGIKFLPPENYLSSLLGYFYYNDEWDKAFAISELLIENYPNNPNAKNNHQLLLEEKKLRNNNV